MTALTRAMTVRDAARLVAALSSAAEYPWQQSSMEIWTARMAGLELTAATEAVERYISESSSFTIAGFLKVYESVVRSRQPATPNSPPRSKPSEGEMVRVRDMLAQFRREHPLVWPKGEPTSPGSARRMAQEPRRAPEDSF